MRISSTVRRAAQINPRGIGSHFGDRERSWVEFTARIAKLAQGLVDIGVRPGDRIAMLALNSDRYLEYFFAVPWAGAVFVPINTRLAPPEIVHWIGDSGASVLMIDDNYLPVLSRLQGQIGSVKTVVHVGDGPAPEGMVAFDSLVEGKSELEPRDSGGDELAALFYTGGTTGRSKGVMLSHGNLLINSLQFGAMAGFRRDSIYLHAPPMFHIANGTCMFALASAGGSGTIIPAFDPVAAMRAIQERKVSIILFVPTMVNMMVNHPQADAFDLTSLKDLIYGASPMPEAVLTKALEVLPGTRFRQAYGQTESAPILTLLEPERHVFEGPLAGKIKAAGQAVPGVELRIVDENDNEVPRNTVGEIVARGDNVMQGYWQQPELTAQTLRGGWLHTGDGGRMDEEGYVYVVDRVKDMIISGGENVYSAEVENAVYQHQAVAECAVIGVPDEKWGERVHAIVRCKDGMTLDAQTLMAFCHELIAGYKCPRSVEIVTDPLPLSGAGKILKTELRKPYWEGLDKQVH